jgi:hypothetical protein
MGPGGGIVFILILITLALWWLVYRRAWTVRVHAYRDYSQSPVKIGVRLPDEVTAYRAAAELVSGFKADGLDALPVWHAEATADPTKHQTGH